jgi:purine-cytosine permease-like protein
VSILETFPVQRRIGMNQPVVRKQSWWQLLSIQAGGTICLPVIMVGHLICQKFGWLAALLGMGLGNVFLLLIGSVLTSLSAERPQSTVEHAACCFGQPGRVLFASLMMLSMLGWFAIQLNVMSLGVMPLLHLAGVAVSPLILSLSVGLLLTCTMCFGMRAIKWVSNVSAPLLGLTLLYAVLSATGSMPLAAPLTLSWLGGVSLVIGANIAAVIDLPTFFRHARSKRDARLCILLLYGLIVPLIEAAGIYLFAVTGGGSVTGVLQAGHGLLWMVWTSCFILLSGWATNYTNLYSALTSSYSLPGRWNPALRTLALGALATALACLNPLGNMDAVLEILSITIGGMGAVILSSYLLEKRPGTDAWISMVSWAIGVAIGLSSFLLHLGITGVPAFDTFIASLIATAGLNYFYKRKKDETVNSR